MRIDAYINVSFGSTYSIYASIQDDLPMARQWVERMKPKKLALISLTLLAILLVGAGVILALSAAEIKANVRWDPKGYTFGDGVPEQWNAEIWLTGGHKAQTEINHTTIRLHDSGVTYEPIYEQITNSTHGPRLIVPFSGTDVWAALDSKLPYHMGVLEPGRYRVSLVINGSLKYTGEEFRGSGVIVYTLPDGSG